MTNTVKVSVNPCDRKWHLEYIDKQSASLLLARKAASNAFFIFNFLFQRVYSCRLIKFKISRTHVWNGSQQITNEIIRFATENRSETRSELMLDRSDKSGSHVRPVSKIVTRRRGSMPRSDFIFSFFLTAFRFSETEFDY